MDIGFNDIQKHHDLFMEHVRSENVEGLRAWKNLGPVSPQKIYRNAFAIAVQDNLLKSMTYLLEHPHFYNKDIYNKGLAMVCLVSQSQHMFDMLYPLSDPHEVMRMLVDDWGCDQWKMLSERMESERLQSALYNAVGNDKEPSQRVLKI